VPIKEISMSTPSASPVKRILVWDLPTRLFHWLLVASFAGAWLTAESESWRLVHVTLGYSVAALVAFRLCWGFVGSRYARFSEFVKGPSAVLAYVKGMLQRRPAHYIGHNPAGAVAILALLLLGGLVTLTGYAAYEELGGHWLEEVHEVLASGMLAVVLVHIVGVIVGSLMHRENLVRAMITGRKEGTPTEGIGSSRRSFALVLVALIGGLWWVQWHDAPAAGTGSQVERKKHHEHDHD
jgi:cytochrome b